MPLEYTEPVSSLLSYGGLDMRRMNKPWPNYLELGFTDKHISELLQMVTDSSLNQAKQDSLEVWAPLHAWRTLGQLQAVEAVESLIRLYERLPDDDWLSAELPKVFALIGPASIPAIAKFLADIGVEEFSRISVPACLEKMSQDHSEYHDECVRVLERQLSSYGINGETLNAFIISSLSNLKATGSIDLIRTAFSEDCVDIAVIGDIEDVEIDMGLRLSRDTPRPKISLIPGLPSLDPDDGHPDDGHLFPSQTVNNHLKKVGRNDPCPCGSGKKFKKCCLQ